MKRWDNWGCTAWVKKALIAFKYLKSCHGDNEGLRLWNAQRTKLGPVGGNYQEADLSLLLGHCSNCHSSSVEGAAWNSGKLPKWRFLNTGWITSWLWECWRGKGLGFMTSKTPFTPKINWFYGNLYLCKEWWDKYPEWHCILDAG